MANKQGIPIPLQNRTLYDDFTVKGKWWLPDPNPVKVDGILTVKAGDDIRLELFAPLTRSGEHGMAMVARSFTDQGDWDVIHGAADDGGAITLFDSMLTNTNFGSAGHTRAEFAPNLCMFGIWYDNADDDVKFDTLRLRFTHLENWINAHPFVTTGFADPDADLIVTYKHPPAIKVTIPDPPMTVELLTNVDHNSSRNESVNLLYSAFVEVKSDQPLSLDAAFRVMADIQKLFTLLVGEQVFVKRMSGRQTVPGLKGGDMSIIEPMFPDGNFVADSPCNVIFTQVEQRPVKRGFAHQMTMPLEEMDGAFPPTLTNWFASLPTLRPLYDVFFSTYRPSRMFTQSRFLHLSQAIESFHRRTIGGNYVPDDEYDSIKTKLTACIPPDLDTGLHAKLVSQIKYGNEPSLHKRLTAIFKTLTKDEAAVVCESSALFISAICGTRNFLTHLSRDQDQIVLDDRHLYHAGKSLESLVTILLLKHLGLPSPKILARITSARRFGSPFPSSAIPPKPKLSVEKQ